MGVLRYLLIILCIIAILISIQISSVLDKVDSILGTYQLRTQVQWELPRGPGIDIGGTRWIPMER